MALVTDVLIVGCHWSFQTSDGDARIAIVGPLVVFLLKVGLFDLASM